MRSTIKSIAAVAAIVAGGLVSLAPSALADSVKPADVSAQASCPDKVWSNKDSGTDRVKSASNIRTGPDTSCTSVGQAQTGQVLDLHCWKAGTTWTWSHVRDTATGKQGWIRDDLLQNGGARTKC